MVKIYRTLIPVRLKCMRLSSLVLSILLTSATLLFAAGPAQAQVTLETKQADIKTVFRLIENQTDVKFTFNESTIREVPRLTLQLRNASLASVLRELTVKSGLQFEPVGKLIAVTAKKNENNPTKPSGNAGSGNNDALKPITGKVIDETGSPIPGATIKINGTKRMAITGIEGQFNLSNVQDNTTLTISFIGYESQTVPVSENMVIRLRKGDSKLDEVQVIAYGTTTQRLSTGSVTKVTAREIAAQPVGNTLGALIGRVPGLLVSQGNGVAGSSFKIQVRGQNAISNISPRDVNSDPLIIIDGVPFAPNNDNINLIGSIGSPVASQGLSPLNLLNPADIESIEILRDADATSIYGSRGAFGVILITTKKGTAGRTTVTANVGTGYSRVANHIKLLNTSQYLDMRKEALKNDGVTANNNNAYDLTLWDPNRYTDWQKEMTGRSSAYTDAQLSLSGGNEQTRFLMNGGYHHESTVFPGELGDNRATMHISIDHSDKSKRFNASLSVNYAADKNNQISANFMQAMLLPPNQPSFYDAAGNIKWEDQGVIYTSNPYASLQSAYSAKSNNLLGNLQLSYKITKDLTARSSFGYNNVRIDEVSIYPSTSQNPLTVQSPGGYSQFGSNSYNSWIMEPQLEYRKKVLKGQLTVLAGGTVQNQDNNYSLINASGFSSDALLKSVQSAATLSATGSLSTYRYEALFARISYNFQDKYLINISGRRDGSSRFGPGRQFGSFGAVGAAWIFTGEDFVRQSLPFLSYGKLRGSYGTSGSDQIGNYQYLDSWRSSQYPYEGNAGITPARLFNPDFGWEINRKLEGALDLGFVKDRILISAAVYRSISDNHLISYALPSQTGFTSITKNFPAVVENTGLEITLNTVNVKTHSFGWKSNLNLTVPRNKLVSFPDLATSSYAGIYTEGKSLSLVQGYEFLGVDPQTGAFKIADKNGDNQLSLADYIDIGSLDPKWYGGLGNQLTFKNWSLDFFIDFKKQLNTNLLGYVYNQNYIPGTMNNIPVNLLQRWQSPGMQAPYPGFTATNTSVIYQSIVNSFSGANSGKYSMITFFRLKSLSLSYNLNEAWLTRYKIRSCRLYVQGQNLFNVSNYKDGDPENPNFLILPPLRTISAGIQVSL